MQSIAHGVRVITAFNALYHFDHFFSDLYILPQFREAATLFGASRFGKLPVSDDALLRDFDLH